MKFAFSALRAKTPRLAHVASVRSIDNVLTHARIMTSMPKPIAVIDKSLFHEICKISSTAERESIWDSLSGKYQIVAPFMLIEEVLINTVRPGDIPRQEVKLMALDLLQLRQWWVEDVHEIAFQELVKSQPLGKLPAPSDELIQGLLASKPNDPKLIKWVEERKVLRKETASRWKQAQAILAPAGFVVATSEKEFFQRTVMREFLLALHEPAKKKDLLETILGGKFRTRHQDCLNEIEEAFSKYTLQSFALFPVVHNCLTARLAYFFGPTVRIQTATDSEPRIILKSKKRRDQDNNVADEQYVITALICDRLVTQDQGMRNIANIFQANGLWRGQTIFIQPGKPLGDQIPHVLN